MLVWLTEITFRPYNAAAKERFWKIEVQQRCRRFGAGGEEVR